MKPDLSGMSNRVAASLALPDTERCLAALRGLAGSIAAAELRLDLMDSFDLARLIRESPCPLIITCRPPREGGRFRGSEAERLALLARAMELGSSYVDIEWDSVEQLSERPRGVTKLIVSRHWAGEAPEELFAVYDTLCDKADVVKLVGVARRVSDVFPVFKLLLRAPRPVIAIATGEAGALTRLLAPCFASCLLTYGTISRTAATAPGQFTVAEMRDRYKLHLVGPQTRISVHLCADGASADAATARNSRAPGEALHVGLVVALEEVHSLAAGLPSAIPNLTVTVESGIFHP
jgi:3-dehydroquinate dehydratase type I